MSTDKRPKAFWVKSDVSDHQICSICGERAPMYFDSAAEEFKEWKAPYCPNCGAEMGAKSD